MLYESDHPVIAQKVDALRDLKTESSAVRRLTSEISTILAVQCAAKEFETISSGEIKQSAAGFSYDSRTTTPDDYVLVPVLRSGQAMLESFQSVLPNPNVPVHHLGIFRDKSSLSPLEYYNMLPAGSKHELAIVLDPVIATGGTAEAVIQTLKEWSVDKIVFCALVASRPGITKLLEQFPDVVFYVGQVDEGLTEAGYISPGVGDVGDRLNATH